MIKQIINRLILYAKSKGLSQTDLADRLDIAKQNLSNWKSGTEKPSLVKFLDFIMLFPEIDLNWLIKDKTTETGGQTITGKFVNSQAGTNITGGNQALATENEFLKQIIKEKEKQIELMEKLIK